MIKPPIKVTNSRSAIDSSEPTIDWMVPTSAAMRPVSSPLGRSWNHDSGCCSNLAYTFERKSATTRSPSQLIR